LDFSAFVRGGRISEDIAWLPPVIWVLVIGTKDCLSSGFISTFSTTALSILLFVIDAAMVIKIVLVIVVNGFDLLYVI
jgi:hypothetical protein